ncbi:hypothetical protein Tco_0911299 [Tanacetum coccineum]|uniref:Uncharacterized protein n=1 Tax=Tanacetum coccineum TaxID=301880 RepID=A0ABQ5CW69_9ASTR
MAEYSQKWHNETSSKARSTETSNGLAAIQAQLNNLGREIKKVNKNVYAAQAYYTKFGAPYQPTGQYRAAGPGFYQRNNINSLYPDRRRTLEESLTKFIAESAKRHEENSNIIKEIRASTDAAIRNHGASIKTLEIPKLNRETAAWQRFDKMAEENIYAPTISDDQLVPVKARLPYGKSNLLLDLQKLQKNLIFRISVDILQNTNFFRAFTASANVPSIYIQQFWNTLTQEAKSGIYSFQLDKQWFPINADLLREALEITPVDPAHPFVSPLWVNRLWTLLTNWAIQRTDKTSGSDKPRHPVLQMLWGIVTRSNVDYAELLWEEFVQGIQTFFSHRASLSIPSKKLTPHVIPYRRFTKLIIYYLGSRHSIHRRPESPVHGTGDDFLLGNLKFIPKGEKDDVFGMPIPKELITKAIQTLPYYQQYQEMPAPAKQTKPVKEKLTKPTPLKKASKGKVKKVRKGKSSLQLVDEEEQVHPELGPEPQVEDEEYDLQRGIQMSLESFQAHGQAPVSGVAIYEPVAEAIRQLPVVEGKGKGIATDEQVDASTGPYAQPEDDTFTNIVRDTPSPTDAETGADTDKMNSESDTEILNIGEEQGEDMSNKVDLEEKTTEIDEGQAGLDPGKTPESRPPPERVLMEEDQAGPNPRQSHVALAGPDPEPMHDGFVATFYPQVHESLKHTTEEHVCWSHFNTFIDRIP